MAGPNPVKYAEDDLGVHSILEGVILARENLDEVLTTLANKRDERRLLEQQLEDLEMEVLIEERGKHADMSATAMKDHIKVALFKNAKWKSIRDSVRVLTNDIEGADLDRKLRERDIEIGCARMNQLGGYLFYLGVAKQERIANKA